MRIIPINYIGYSAFNSCSALENIVIPENVDSIAGFAFFRLLGFDLDSHS